MSEHTNPRLSPVSHLAAFALGAAATAVVGVVAPVLGRQLRPAVIRTIKQVIRVGRAVRGAAESVAGNLSDTYAEARRELEAEDVAVAE